jgi:hypothetical protein
LSSRCFEAVLERLSHGYAIIPLINPSMAQEREPQLTQERGLPLTEAELHDGLLGKLANAGQGEFLPSSGKLEYTITPVHNDAGKPSTKERAGNVLRNVSATIKKTVFGK